MHRVLAWFAAGAFLVEVVLAEFALRLLWGRSIADLLLNDHDLGLGLATGLLVAVVVAALTRAFFDTFARELTRELFLPILGRVTNLEIAGLAILPGLGEELLFRGALQSAIGIVPASIVFGLLHSGFSRKLLPYGIWAFLVGAVLGTVFQWTGNLWGSIVAHAAINASGAVWARRTWARERMAGTGDE